MPASAPTTSTIITPAMSFVAGRVLLPFACGYFMSYLFRSVNAVIAPNLQRDLGIGAGDLGTLTAAYFGRMIHERFERIQAQLADMSAVTQEALSGVRVVRAYRQEARELERFRIANLEYVDRNRALIRLQGLFYPSLGLFMGLSELLVLWMGSRDVMAGRMTVGGCPAATHRTK